MKLKDKLAVHVPYETFLKELKISRKIYDSGKLEYIGKYKDPHGIVFTDELELKLHLVEEIDDYDSFAVDQLAESIMLQINKG